MLKVKDRLRQRGTVFVKNRSEDDHWLWKQCCFRYHGYRTIWSCPVSRLMTEPPEKRGEEGGRTTALVSPSVLPLTRRPEQRPLVSGLLLCLRITGCELWGEGPGPGAQVTRIRGRCR